MLKLCRITNFDLFFSFLEMLWLHIVLGVTISHDPLLPIGSWTRTQFNISFVSGLKPETNKKGLGLRLKSFIQLVSLCYKLLKHSHIWIQFSVQVSSRKGWHKALASTLLCIYIYSIYIYTYIYIYVSFSLYIYNLCLLHHQ